MWRAVDQYGNLAYSFIDTVNALHPYYVIRGVGGLLYLIGFVLFAYNMYKTWTAGEKVEETTESYNATPMSN
jgi:cytochrome c oxidase cbb3-type subunit 1